MDYVECLFVGPGNKPKKSPLKNNLIHTVDSALTHVVFGWGFPPKSLLIRESDMLSVAHA